jgi:hypothetical protein
VVPSDRELGVTKPLESHAGGQLARPIARRRRPRHQLDLAIVGQPHPVEFQDDEGSRSEEFQAHGTDLDES